MKFIAPLCLAFACFTAPHGDLGIWVLPSQVVSVLHAQGCDSAAKTTIVTLAGNLCVVESPQEVKSVLEKVSKDDK